VYTRGAKSTIDVPIFPVSLITNTISDENVISSFSIDIDSSVDIDYQSDLNISIAHCKGKKKLHSTSTV